MYFKAYQDIVTSCRVNLLVSLHYLCLHSLLFRDADVLQKEGWYKADKMCIPHANVDCNKRSCGCGLRATVACYNLDKMALRCYMDKFKEDQSTTFEPGYNASQVFSNGEKTMLSTYLKKAVKLQYGLKTISYRKLAYEFAKSKRRKYPQTWTQIQLLDMIGFMVS